MVSQHGLSAGLIFGRLKIDVLYPTMGIVATFVFILQDCIYLTGVGESMGEVFESDCMGHQVRPDTWVLRVVVREF